MPCFCFVGPPSTFSNRVCFYQSSLKFYRWRAAVEGEIRKSLIFSIFGIHEKDSALNALIVSRVNQKRMPAENTHCVWIRRTTTQANGVMYDPTFHYHTILNVFFFLLRLYGWPPRNPNQANLFLPSSPIVVVRLPRRTAGSMSVRLYCRVREEGSIKNHIVEYVTLSRK